MRTALDRRLPGRIVVLVAVLLCSVPALATPSNKWRMELDGRAKMDGEIELSVTPEGGDVTRVVIAIPARTSENAAAKLLRDEIRRVFGESVYQTEVDDGEDVLMKARGSTPDFELVVIRNTVQGLDIALDRE